MKYTGDKQHEPLVDSCYVSVAPTKSSIYRFLNWVSAMGDSFYRDEIFLKREQLHDLYANAHVTIMYSKNKAPDDKQARSRAHYRYDVPIVGQVSSFEEWPGHDGDGYLVAKIDSPILHRMHEKWKNMGCEHSFPDYEPHMTVITPYRPGSVNIDAINERLQKVPLILEFVNETAVPVA